MKSRDYYDVLELPPDASQQSIKEQYHFLLHAWHPDKFPNPQQKIKAQERTKELNEAYSVLRDAARRAQYDALRNDEKSEHSQSATSAQEEKDKQDRTKRRAEYERQQRERDEAEAQRVEEERQQRVKAEAERLRAEQERKQRPNSKPNEQNDKFEIPPDFPVICDGCWCSDSSLRYALFPYVISLVIVTSRRAWHGLYCERCRRRKMLKAKLLTLCFGWWGIPFGIFYTLGVLFKPSQGYIPADVNAVYLRGLGAFFLNRDRIIDAEQALTASLSHQYDEKVNAFYQQVFNRKPRLPSHINYGAGTGFLFGTGALIFSLLVLIYALTDNSQQGPKSTTFVEAPTTFEQTSTFKPSPPPLRVVTPKSSPTLNGVLTSKPAPTLTIVQPNPPKGWKKYTSKQTKFIAYLPPKFVPQEHLIKEGDTARTVSFTPDSQHIGPDSIVISVMYLPYLDITAREPTESELKEYISKWLIQGDIKIITPPVKINVINYLAFELVHEVTIPDKNYVGRVHAAFVSTPDGLYYIEVAGFLDYDYAVKEYYDTFMKWFQPAKSK